MHGKASSIGHLKSPLHPDFTSGDFLRCKFNVTNWSIIENYENCRANTNGTKN
jgi:hypothetical protein